MKRTFHTKVIGAMLFLGTLVPAGMQAQDFHLSQYEAAPLYLNPAMTGMFNGHYRIHAHYRNQWRAIATKPFTTAGASFDMPYKKYAFGAQILNYRAGTGNYNALSFLLSGGYDYAIDNKTNNYHHISGGLQLGFLHKSVNLNKLTWGNQYVGTQGGQFDVGIASGESAGSVSQFMPDLNMGIMYYFADNRARFNPFAGLSVNHINHPDEAYFSASKLPVHWTIHAGTKIGINEKIQLMPQFMNMHQTNDRELTMSMYLHYYLTESDAYIIFGPTYRISGPLSKSKPGYREKDAFVLEAGFKQGDYIYKISYDINTSTLKPVSDGKGALELSITYTPKRQNPNPIPSCPRL